MRKFKNIDRETPMLLPPDLREWVPRQDMVHFVIEAIDGMNLKRFKANELGTGSEQYPPGTMLALLIYCYASGIFSSRRIEAATYNHLSVRYLTADNHPDHDTICKFRRENFDAVAECFTQVLELASELKLLRLGTVSVDGTKIKANASKHKNVGYRRAGQLVEQLEMEVRELMDKAEEADRHDKEDGGCLPEEVARRETLRKKMESARRKLQERARRRAEAERAAYERKLAEREKRSGSRKGKRVKPPEEDPKPDEQINLVDEDSRLMRKNKRSGYEQAYNAQAVVDADGSQMVLSARVSQCASDRNELVEDVRGIPEGTGKAMCVLADSGYACGEQVAELEAKGMDVYVSTGAEHKQGHRRYDYRPEKARIKDEPKVRAQWIKRMRDKMQTDVGKALYARRKQTVEPVFGIIKQCMGFRQFLLRGKEKVSGEWQLVSLAYNFKRLWNLKQAVI
jgi:transposase